MVGLDLDVAFAVVSVLVVATAAFLLRARSRGATPPHRGEDLCRHTTAVADVVSVDVEAGLDEAALKMLPKVVYGELEAVVASKTAIATAAAGAGASTCCAVCLGEYAGGDALRVLPECSHAFHQRCVVFRSPPVPIPVTTLLAAPHTPEQLQKMNPSRFPAASDLKIQQKHHITHGDSFCLTGGWTPTFQPVLFFP